MVIDDTTNQLVPLTIEERERALGYAVGSTNAPEMQHSKDSYIRRHQITGRCMDARAMMYLLAVSLAIRSALHDPSGKPAPPLTDRTFPLTAASARVSAYGDHTQSTDPASMLTSTAVSASSMADQAIQTSSASQQLGGEDSSTGTLVQLNFSNCCDSEQSYILRRNVAAAAMADIQDSVLSVRLGPEMAQPETADSGRKEGPAIHTLQSDGRLDHTYAGQARDENLQPPMSAALDSNYIADVWMDELSLQYIKMGEFTPCNLQQTSREERLRVIRRCKCYYMVSGKLYRKMSSGEAKEVPPPSERISVVMDIHNQTGHFGRRRTTHLLMMQYWWSGLYNDVRKAVAACPSCSRVTSSNFGARSPELQPLPIMGMFYRWHVDLAGPFPVTSQGNTYVMVCVEAFSKHAELIPSPSKDSNVTARAFLHNVIARFGACAEVVTDQGKEWDGEFYELLTDCFIDHRRTSANRPQSNGLAERCVQTLKTCLRKLITGQKGGAEKWDEHVAWIALGYRVTPHDTTKMAPYQMLYAVSPIIPPNIKARMAEPINFDSPEQAAKQIARRAKEVQTSCIIAGWNGLIAQHRDTLRYAKTRGGAHVPKMRRYEVGDYVYVKYRTKPDTLHPHVRPEILRILQVRKGKDGHDLVLRLQGRDGLTTDEHFSNCVPCHLPIEDESLQLGKVPIDFHCQQCGFPDDEKLLLLCDRCNRGWHTYCLEPKLASVPEGNWYCPGCAIHPEVLAAAKAEVSRMSPLAAPFVPAEEAGPSTPTATNISEVEPVAGLSPTPKRKVVLWAHPLVIGASKPTNQSADGRTRLQRKREVVQLKSCIKTAGGSIGSSNLNPNDTFRIPPQKEVPKVVPVPVRTGPSKAVRFPHTFDRFEELATYRANKIASSVSLVTPTDLPASFNVMDWMETESMLKRLMPGDWSAGQVKLWFDGLHNVNFRLQKEPDFTDGNSLVTRAQRAVQLLEEAIDFGCLYSVVDMFAGRQSTCHHFTHKPEVLVNDLNQKLHLVSYHYDALQPCVYQYFRRRQGMEAIVITPPPELLDMALPLAVEYAELVVCCQVPRTCVTEPPHEHRIPWLRSLQQEERLIFIPVIPPGASEPQPPEKCELVWIVVFKTQAIGEWLKKPYTGFCKMFEEGA